MLFITSQDLSLLLVPLNQDLSLVFLPIPEDLIKLFDELPLHLKKIVSRKGEKGALPYSLHREFAIYSLKIEIVIFFLINVYLTEMITLFNHLILSVVILE